ncbi:Protein trichome birefringence-like [Quillaja saponaria]|uniref:Protein trichome birefringence-like n=1 Tax=Quillaja saponaria TaxID=32244 RepID=A0AAD7Q940_QUISA|nr:Protein trichome birefringence-like [Quillaja saponaria]
MRVRSSRNDPKDRSLIRSYPREETHGVWSSENQFRSTTTSPIDKGIGCRKKMKSAARDRDSPLSCREDNSSLPSERNEGTRYNEPKTSEYAFFKKLKGDAGQRCHSHSLYKEAYLSKKPESSDCSRERTNIFRSNSKEDAGQRILSRSLYKEAYLSKKPESSDFSRERKNIIKSNCKDFRSPAFNDNVTSVNFDTFLSPFGDASKNGGVHHKGTQHEHAEVFSRKRQKLRQLVADASFQDIDETYSKGHDIVYMLLSRLYPKSNEDSQFFRDPPPEKDGVATNSHSLALSELNIEFNQSHQIPMRKFTGLESGSYAEDGLLSPMFNRSEERNTSYYDPLTSPFNKSHPQYSRTRSVRELDGIPSYVTERDLTSGFLFNDYESFTSLHFEDPCEVGREPGTLQLGWESDSKTNKICLPLTYRNIETNVEPTLLTSMDYDQEHRMDNMICQYGICSSSIVSDQLEDFTSLGDSCLVSHPQHKFGKCVLADNEQLDTNFNHNSLTLSCTNDYLKLVEDCIKETSCVQDSIYLSPQNQHLFRSKFLKDYHHHPVTEACISSALDFNSSWKCLSLIGSSGDPQLSTYNALQFPQKESLYSLFHSKDDYEDHLDGHSHEEMLYHFREDVFKICKPSPFLKISMDRSKTFPLLLDDSEDVDDSKQMHHII